MYIKLSDSQQTLDSQRLDSQIRVLLAVPGLDSGIFSKSVVVMQQNEDSKTDFGCIVNKQVQCSISAQEFDFFSDDKILIGGPVGEQELWVLHTAQAPYDGSIAFASDVYLTHFQQFFAQMSKGVPEIEGAMIDLCIGYSQWGEAQLKNEIARGYWWEMHCPAKVIFNSPHDQRWQAAWQYLGVSQNTSFPFCDHSVVLN